MSYLPGAMRSFGECDTPVSALGFGAASIGRGATPVTEAVARATVEHAWDLGIRYFDVAPLYGFGLSEERLGAVLRHRPRDHYTVSTKVGRSIATDRASTSFDFSADGVRRSLEGSLERLGLDRVDIAFLHDPDDHWTEAAGQAMPTLMRLREEGVLRAIGVGMNQVPMLLRFATEADPDVLLVANRWTLLDRTAGELLTICQARSIAVVLGGILNSGLLAHPMPGATFDYRPADDASLARANRLRAITERFGVPLKAAAVQFGLRHPAVVSVLAGVATVEHLAEYPTLLAWPIPDDLWHEIDDISADQPA